MQRVNPNTMYVPPYGPLKRSVSSMQSRDIAQEIIPTAGQGNQTVDHMSDLPITEEKSHVEVTKVHAHEVSIDDYLRQDPSGNVRTPTRRHSIGMQEPGTPVRGEVTDEIPSNVCTSCTLHITFI